MNKIDFKYKVIPGVTEVVVTHRDHDMPQGWEEDMDDMVGLPLVVREKGLDYVVLDHPDGDDSYTFGVSHIMLASTRKKKVRLRDYKLKVLEELSVQALQAVLLVEDRDALRKLEGVDFNQPHIVITSELLEEIQNKCPRVIGAMLSNNLMEREI